MPYTFLPRPVPLTRPLSRTRALKAASSPASEPVIGGGGHGGALLDGLHAALRLEAGEGRVQRAEADRGAARQQLTEPLLQLVAVELLLREQAEDGEVDHEGRGIGSLHRSDVSIRCNDRVHDSVTIRQHPTRRDVGHAAASAARR